MIVRADPPGDSAVEEVLASTACAAGLPEGLETAGAGEEPAQATPAVLTDRPQCCALDADELGQRGRLQRAQQGDVLSADESSSNTGSRAERLTCHLMAHLQMHATADDIIT